jgi:hypothetical protein
MKNTKVGLSPHKGGSLSYRKTQRKHRVGECKGAYSSANGPKKNREEQSANGPKKTKKKTDHRTKKKEQKRETAKQERAKRESHKKSACRVAQHL